MRNQLCIIILCRTFLSAENKTKSQQTIAPLILRSLTELFLNVENLAEVYTSPFPETDCLLSVILQRWGVSQTMVVETLTKESLETWLEKGISNVAFLSLGMGLENTASTAFAEAKVWTHGMSQWQ